MRPRTWLLVSLTLAAIVYGSLYPFIFHVPAADSGALSGLLQTWRRPPQSRGDLLANILFYMPLGFTLGRALEERLARKTALALTIAIGAALSFSLELSQHFDAGRVSCMSDFYMNTIGTAAGAVAGIAVGDQLLAAELVPHEASLFACLLLLAWLGWRLFPYEPVIDLHKYWASVKPLVRTPSLGAYGLFRFTALWAAVLYLVQFGLKVREAWLTGAVAMMAVFGAKILIIDQIITLPEVLGATLAYFYLVFVLSPQPGVGTRLLAALFLLSIALERILPLQIAETTRPFEWIPFYGFLHGSLAVNTQSFMQKIFLYGTGLYLLLDAGLGLIWAALLEGLIILATSLFETMLVGRSAEITDALMVLLLAVIAHVLASVSRPEQPLGASVPRPRAP